MNFYYVQKLSPLDWNTKGKNLCICEFSLLGREFKSLECIIDLQNIIGVFQDTRWHFVGIYENVDKTEVSSLEGCPQGDSCLWCLRFYKHQN